MAGFSSGQRVVVVVAVVTLIAGGVFFAQWASKPTLVPLFSNLESSDAAAITSKLASQNVPYELSNEGSTIMVPQSKVYQLRLDLSADGLPTGGSEGYKLLDKQGITTSEFRQHVDYQRALEGELASTIGAINGVEAAAVHLVIPKQDVFADDTSKSTASVLIKTEPGKSLSGQQVRAVVNLVASSVEGLETGNVTVADDKGRVLAAPGQDASSGDSDAQTQATSTLEDSLTKKIQDMLTPLVGSGKSVVQARAELNFDKSQSTTEIWNPNNRESSPTSSHNVTETYTGSDPNSTGILGPDGSGTSSTSGTGDYSKQDLTQDFGVDRQVTQSQQAPGKIDRISVAVLLDSNVANVDPAEVEKLVSDAAGLSAARGDTVTVSRMAFDTTQASAASEELKAAEAAEKQAQMMDIIKMVGTFLIIIAVLVVLFITTKRRAKNYSSMPLSMAELEAARPASADDMLSALDGRPASFELDSPEAQERAKVDKEITDLIEKQPDEVASLLRSWIADRRS